jgi:hypothetical protein
MSATVFLTIWRHLHAFSPCVCLRWNVSLCFWLDDDLFLLSARVYTFTAVSHCASDRISTFFWFQLVPMLSLECFTELPTGWHPHVFSWSVCFCWSVTASHRPMISPCFQFVRMLLLVYHTVFLTGWRLLHSACLYAFTRASHCVSNGMTTFSHFSSCVCFDWSITLHFWPADDHLFSVGLYSLAGVSQCFSQSDDLFMLLARVYDSAGMHHYVSDWLATSSCS